MKKGVGPIVLAVIVAALTFVADFKVSPHIHTPILYVAAVALTLNLSRQGIFLTASGTCVLTIVGALFPTYGEFTWQILLSPGFAEVIANRILVLTAIATTGFLTAHISHAVRTGREDQLTRVFNRRGLEAELASRGTKPTAAILIDIDDFKRINDTWGLLVGDIVLKEVAEMLTTVARSTDIICRYGGDEFIVLLSNTTVPQARKISERIYRLLSNARVEVNDDGAYVRITASLGVSPLQEDATISETVRRTQIALKKSKGDGKNCITFIDILGEKVELQEVTPVPVASEQ